MALPEEVINSRRVPRLGPYSQAVRVGNLVFTAGQAGIDPATGQSAGPTFEAQARQAFANLRAVLEANGMSVTNLVKTTVFLTDRSLLASFRAARDAVYGGHAPCSTLLFVAGLADPRFMVEIEAEAVA